MKRVLMGVVAVAAVVVIMGAWGWSKISSQGVTDEEWKTLFPESVDFDYIGIPTITADTWEAAIEQQGFIHAAERLWQMDVMRRAAVGALGEWFGSRMRPRDFNQKVLGISDMLNRAASGLPRKQREHCEIYAKGVNQFIDKFEGRWGIEYEILFDEPKPWTCADSIAVFYLLNEDLSSHLMTDRIRWSWRKAVPEAWYQFLFTSSHPWNAPIFGDNKPEDWAKLPQLEKADLKSLNERKIAKIETAIGSNSWAVRGLNGRLILANDPHLEPRVPQLWYASRLKIDNKLIVGATLPGVFGVVIGSADDKAWAFTNTGEDVDDQYRVRVDWESRNYEILGDADAVVAVGTLTSNVVEQGLEIPAGQEFRQYSTSFGPLLDSLDMENNIYLVRKWGGYDPSLFRLPTVELNQARNWNEVNAALDQMRTPSQNCIVSFRNGDIGYRATGTGMERDDSKNVSIDGNGLFVGWAENSSRKRKLFSARGSHEPMVLAISNQRLWTDGQTHSWSSDDRAQRITEIFDGNLGGDLVELSQKAQLDTKSRFAKELLTFIASNLEQGEGNRETLKRWSQWAGVSDQEGAKTYQDSLNAEEHLTNIVLALILEKYDRQQTVQSYKHLLRRGWLTRIISEPAILERLGVDAKELSQVIYRRVLRDRKEMPYQIRNRWQAQHLFAGNVPIIGNLFKVESFPQFGSSYVLRVEGPANTASMRLIWDLEEPRNSRWSFPVGQSGHLRSEHFDDLRKNWSKGVYQPIFL